MKCKKLLLVVAVCLMTLQAKPMKEAEEKDNMRDNLKTLVKGLTKVFAEIVGETKQEIATVDEHSTKAKVNQSLTRVKRQIKEIKKLIQEAKKSNAPKTAHFRIRKFRKKLFDLKTVRDALKIELAQYAIENEESEAESDADDESSNEEDDE